MNAVADPSAGGRPRLGRFAAIGVVVAFAAAACSGPSAGPGDAPSGIVDPDAAWRTTELTDARTGESFRIADLDGRVVVIEPMAIWCINCRYQQRQAQAALAELAPSDVAYVSLDVDPRETQADLARYAEREGFDWRFALAPAEVSRSLADEFGDIVLAPPSTPIIVLDPAGGVVAFSLGGESPADLVAFVKDHSG